MLFEVSIQIASYFSLVSTEYSFQTPIRHQDILTHLCTTSFDSPPPRPPMLSPLAWNSLICWNTALPFLTWHEWMKKVVLQAEITVHSHVRLNISVQLNDLYSFLRHRLNVQVLVIHDTQCWAFSKLWLIWINFTRSCNFISCAIWRNDLSRQIHQK